MIPGKPHKGGILRTSGGFEAIQKSWKQNLQLSEKAGNRNGFDGADGIFRRNL